MNTIKLILDENASGQIKTAVKNFNVYQGAVGTVGIEIYVPRNMLNSPMVDNDGQFVGSNAVTIYAAAITETGKTVTTAAEQCYFLRKEIVDGIEYYVFTRVSGLPQSFLRYAGTLTICASVFKTYEAGDGSIKLENRSKMQKFAVTVLDNPDSESNLEYEASDEVSRQLENALEALELIYGGENASGTITAPSPVNLSTLKTNKAELLETMLKYDAVNEYGLILSRGLDYTQDGYKTLGVAFYNATCNVPGVSGSPENHNGMIIATNHRNGTNCLYQDEVFICENSIYQRTLTLDVGETHLPMPNNNTAWKTIYASWLETATEHADTKIPRVMDAHQNNIAKFDNNGNLEDSGVPIDLLATHSSQIAALQGRGGALHYIVTNDNTDPYYVAVDTVENSQRALTEYACTQIWGAGYLCTQADGTDEVAANAVITKATLAGLYWNGTERGEVHAVNEIYNATWMRNATNNHRYELTNTPDTNPIVFEWADVGIDTTATATNVAQGVVKGVADDGEHDYKARVNEAGEMEVNLSQSKKRAIESGATAEKVGDYDNHLANENNPHNVTKAQVGLGNADNTADLDKPISTATQTALDLKANQSQVDTLQNNFDDFVLNWTE